VINTRFGNETGVCGLLCCSFAAVG